MVLGILFLVLSVIYFILGTKRGFIYEFFCVFKYILIIFIMKYVYIPLEEIFKFSGDTYKYRANMYFTIFIILYLILSLILFFAKDFLKSIRIENFNEITGGILGILETIFMIFIIYIIILTGSSYSKRFMEIRSKIKITSGIIEYIGVYSHGFPEFIQDEISLYLKEIKEEELEKNILNLLKKKSENSEKTKIVKKDMKR